MDKKEIKILLVDDEKDIVKWTKKDLQSQAYTVYTALSGPDALDILRDNQIDVLVTDNKMYPMDGLELIRHAQKLKPDLQSIVFTAYADVDTCRESFKLSAVDYLPKPVDKKDLFEAVQLAIQKKTEAEEKNKSGLFIDIEDFPHTDEQIQEIKRVKKISGKYIIGNSKAIEEVFKLIAKVSSTETTVLITGESGTGKELVARAIHENSHRHNFPFQAFNCRALPENLFESELFGYKKGAFTGAVRDKKGKFEEADRGTIFLDEIGDMALTVQIKFLRVLEEKKITRLGDNKSKEVNVRIIAATNKDLKKEIEMGNFREELYYRVGVFLIHLPPLREREEDIEPLVKYFINKLNLPTRRQVKSIESKAIERLKQYEWPGNIRELSNVVERALVKLDCNSTVLREEHFDLPPLGRKKGPRRGESEPDSFQTEKPILKKYDPYCYDDPIRCDVRRVKSGEKSWKEFEESSFPEKERIIALAIETGFKREIMANIMGITKNNLNVKLFRQHIQFREIKSLCKQ